MKKLRLQKKLKKELDTLRILISRILDLFQIPRDGYLSMKGFLSLLRKKYKHLKKKLTRTQGVDVVD
jgi:hypothetical protein